MSALLTLDSVTRYFGGLAAVAGITMHVNEGELAGLIGPNGAGKTTVFNLLTGVYAPTGGTVQFAGQILNRKRPCQVATAGIARTFQNVRLFRTLTVLQNVKVAANVRSRRGLLSSIVLPPGQVREDRNIEAECMDLLARFGLEPYAHERSDSLAYGLQRRLEIARALATRPRLLLLDEPAAGMNPNEKSDLMGLIEHLRTDFSLTVLLIEHDMKLVMGICERIYVLDYGQIISEGTPEQISSDPKVIAAYLGTSDDEPAAGTELN